MTKIKIKWSAQESSVCTADLEDYGTTKEEFEAMPDNEKEELVQKILDDLPEEVSKFSDGHEIV